MGNTTKIASYINYCRKHNIQVLPPDINKSDVKFTVEDGNIRFSLVAVKNVGHAAISDIIKVRNKQGEFKNIFDFCEKTSEFINKRMVESLIKAGSFDYTGIYRSKMIAIYENVIDGVQKNNRANLQGQMTLFGGESVVVPRPNYPEVRRLPQRALLAMEKEVTGIYITGHPLLEYKDVLELFNANSTMFGDEISEDNQVVDEENIKSDMLRDGQIVEIAGIVVARQTKATRSNDMMCFLTIEDLFGTVEVIIFPRQYHSFANILHTDNIIGVKGRASHREGEAIKLVAEKIWELKKGVEAKKVLQEDNKKLYLKIAKELDDTIFDEIKNILRKYQGSSAVYIFDEKNNKKYLMDRKLWVQINDDLINELKKIINSNHIVVR
jgi:DNA polymerase-3 subunit alpha